MFFETYFNLQNVESLEDEQKVCCPFPHSLGDGREHKDFHPSLQINLKKRVFNCPACGAKGNEIQFIQKVFNCTSQKATKFLNTLKTLNVRYDDLIAQQWRDYSDDELEAITNLGIDPDVLRQMGVFVELVQDHYEYSFPVTWKGLVCDIRTYRPGCTPKVLSEPGAQTGLVIPFDLWQASDKRRWTLLCAGEKDMAVARSRGFNAITLTGGEVSTPLSPEWFSDRKIAIVYDNDFAGINGANKVATAIAPYAAEVRVVTKFHEDFGKPNTKEDITDWFTKYGGTKEKMEACIKATPKFEVNTTVEHFEAPLVSLKEAIKTYNIGKELRSDIQLITTSDSKYDVPCHASVKKFSGKGRLKEGDQLTWTYDLNDDSTSKDIVFEMIGVSRDKQKSIITRSLGLGGEAGLGVFIKSYNIMYACRVADKEGTEADMFFIGEDPGRHSKLNVTYFRLDNPSNGECALLAYAWSEPVDDTEHFEITESVKQSITFVQNHEGSVADRVNHRAEAVRGLLGYEANTDLIKAIDFCFNSIKEFHYGNQKNVKGFLDCLIIGESRIGKSDTAKKLRDTYDLGAFVSLAGSAATIPGIIGGSVKDAVGRNATKAGVIPRNNGSCIVFEELAKCERELIKSLTDVRSSGLARITRVSGSVEIPAAVRMCTLSNVRPTSTGESRPIASYSSGVEIIKDLIGTAEDIARYDYSYIQGEDGTESDPLYMAPDPYPTEVLQDVIRWAWSRKADDVIWEDGVEVYLSNQAKELNRKYPMHIKLFGTECWKKLCRLSCAIAAYICNTDESYSHLVITKEIVDVAVDYLVHIYDNDTFKIMVIVTQTQARENVVDKHTEILQSMYIKWKEAFDYLYAQGHVDSNTFKDLCSISDGKEMSGVVRSLINLDFIIKDGAYILSTPKFRKTYALLNKNTEVEKV